MVAQDNATVPNVGSFPSVGAGGFTPNPPAAATPPANPTSYVITQTGLSGTYTVGLTLFNSLSGRNITFNKSVQKVLKEVWVESTNVEKQVEKGMESKDVITETSDKPAGYFKLMEVEEIN